MLIFLICLVIVVVLLFLYIKNGYNYWIDRGVPQKGFLELFVNQWKLLLGITHISERDQEIYDQFPDAKYIGCYQFSTPALIMKDPDIIKKIVVKDFDYFVDRQFPIDVSNDPLWRKNLVVLEGEKWKDTRVLLSPTFTSNKMKSLFFLVKECAQTYGNFFSNKKEKIIEYEVSDIVTRYTNDVIATCAFGIKTDSLKDRNNEFYLQGRESVNFNWKRNLQNLVFAVSPALYRYLKFTFIPLGVWKFFREMIVETVRIRNEKNIVRPDMIQIMMEARKALKQNRNGKNYDLSDEDMVAHAFLFFVGGIDTVSATLTFLLYELALNPDVQSRLRKEIGETTKRCNGDLTYDALMQMKYMDMVVSEVLRKWTPMSQINRKCTKPYLLEPAMPGYNSVELETGTVIILPLVSIHRDPKLFPNPMKFDPERFENKDEVNQYAYLAFGTGPRNCIGSRFAQMKTKTFAFYLLSNFEIVPVEKTEIDIKLNPRSFSLKPNNGLWLGFKRIN